MSNTEEAGLSESLRSSKSASAPGRSAKRDAKTSQIVFALNQHRAALALLLGIFVARLMLADWNSYWNDEIISVYQYGTSQDSLWAAISALAQGSIHPPLYQSILYVWIQVFGDLEIATRTLSNIFMTLAAGFLYAFLARTWGNRWALVAIIGFSVSASATYYGLETRSYAMTMMLTAASSYFAWLALQRKYGTSGSVGRAAWPIALVVTLNFALMMVHYYNVFWLIAQALFVAVYMLVETPKDVKAKAMLAAAALAAVPVAGFFMLWGFVLRRQYESQSEAFAVEGSVSATPLELIDRSVFSPNLSLPAAGIVIVFVAIVLTTAFSVARIVVRRPDSRAKDWSNVYLSFWLFVPIIITVAVFATVGVERYSVRYFLFSVAPLSALIVISIIQAFTLARTPGRGKLTAAPESTSVYTAIGASALMLALFLPGGVDSATDRKADWRGIAQDVVTLVETDSRHSYTIIDTSFGSGSRSQYYFERFSDSIGVDVVASRRLEREANFADFAQRLPDPVESERLVLVLNHHTKAGFASLVDFLDAEYGTVIEVLSDQQRGFIVFGRS